MRKRGVGMLNRYAWRRGRRTPIRSALLVVILACAATFLSLTLGLYASAVKSAEGSADAFTTFAVRTPLGISAMSHHAPYFTSEFLMSTYEKGEEMDTWFRYYDIGYVEAETYPGVLDVDRRRLAMVYNDALQSVVLETGALANQPEMYAMSLYVGTYQGMDDSPTAHPKFTHAVPLITHPDLTTADTLEYAVVGAIDCIEGKSYVLCGAYIDFRGADWLKEEDKQRQDLMARHNANFFYKQPLLLPEHTTILEDILNAWPELSPLCTALEMARSSVQVLTVNHLDALVPFALGEAFIQEGRAFTVPEQPSERYECLVPTALAQKNGLALGDTLELSLYRGETFGSSYIDMGLGGVGALYSEPWPDYDPSIESIIARVDGFSEHIKLEIVGLYHAPWWTNNEHGLTPNTVLVPDQALQEAYYGLPAGIFYSILLENGEIEGFREYADSLGYGDMFLFFDQGYSAFQETVARLKDTARLMLALGFLLFVGVAAFFQLFYVRHLRTDIAAMLALGVDKRSVFRFAAVAIAVLIALSVLVGGGVSMLLHRTVLDTAFDAASDRLAETDGFSGEGMIESPGTQRKLSGLPWLMVLATCLEGLFLAGVSLWTVWRTLRKPPIVLLSEKGG